MTPQPPPPAAAAPKNRGCLIALAVVAGLGLLVCLVGGIAAWRLSKDPDVAKALNLATKGAKLAMESNKAVGTNELRAAGCPEAMVVDGREMIDLVDQFVDGGIEQTEDPGLMVMCQGNSLSQSLPSCDELAHVYVKAAKPTRTFTITVTKQNQQVCEAKYAPDGTPAAEDPQGEADDDGDDDGDEAGGDEK